MQSQQINPLDNDKDPLHQQPKQSGKARLEALDMIPKVVRGVLFGRSIRSYYAILHVASSSDNTTSPPGDDSRVHVVVRIQFHERVKELRSWCRRRLKLGDLLCVYGEWKSVAESASTDWKQERFVVDVSSLQRANEAVQVKAVRHWNMIQCQEWQKQCLAISRIEAEATNTKKPQRKESKRQNHPLSQEADPDITPSQNNFSSQAYRHGGGMGKRIQGQIVSNFLISILMEKLGNSINTVDSTDTSFQIGHIKDWHASNGAENNENKELRSRAIQLLNSGSGVIDAAGGSGHVSMALGMAGIKSTVVDPRESVGKLPGRDRKIWYRALKKQRQNDASSTTSVIDPSPATNSDTVVQEYNTMRAWFGAKPPDGVDTAFRHPDQPVLCTVCCETTDLVKNCSAIVALHPDEATGAVVELAVKNRIPFLVVPCCVFCRLFPNRQKPTKEPVSTYEDLLEYLLGKHPSIQAAKLPFEGANIALWSTF